MRLRVWVWEGKWAEMSYSIRCQGVQDNLGADLGRSRENPNGTSKRSTAEASANASV